MTLPHFVTRVFLSVLLVGSVILAAGCGQEPPAEPTPSAAVDDPQVLTNDQAELLAVMPYRNHLAEVVGFHGHLLEEHGDLLVVGWIDFAEGRGVVELVTSAGDAVLVVWDADWIAYLDQPGGGGSDGLQLPLPEGDWQTGAFDPHATGLTRLLAALLLLADDRPQNPMLVRQSGARHLGHAQVNGIHTEHFSGPTADGDSSRVELGTQYWIDGTGRLQRFGFRADPSGLSTVEFVDNAGVPDALPCVKDVPASEPPGELR